MPFALVKESGSGMNAGANSYADTDDADAFHASSINGSAWTGVTDASKKAVALVQATRTLDSLIQWPGARVLAKQPLGWPRRYATQDGVPLDADAVPLPVVAATCEFARILLLSGDPTLEAAASAQDKIASVTIGPIKTDFRAAALSGDKGEQLDQALPRSVMALLRPILSGVGETGGTRFVSTVRV